MPPGAVPRPASPPRLRPPRRRWSRTCCGSSRWSPRSSTLESRERACSAERESAAALGIEQHLLRSVTANRFGVAAANSIGPDGFVPGHSTRPVMEGTYVGDRETIAAQLRGEWPGLAVSRPVLGRASNRWSLLVTRPLFDMAGRIQGVGSVLLDPVVLGTDLATQLPQPGRGAILRGLPDGTILARSREAEADLARAPAPDHPLIQAARAAPSGTIEYRRKRDNQPVLAGWRVPPGLPVVVAAVIDVEAELAGLRIHRCAVITAASLTVILGLGLALALGAWLENRSRSGRAWPRRWCGSAATSWPCWCTRSARR